MTSDLSALCFAANDPLRLGRFWAAVLGRDLIEGGDDVTLVAGDTTEFPIRFHSTAEPKTAPNQMHFDLTSTSLVDQEWTVARALEMGARRLDIGQGPDDEQVVLADPEGNEFCVIEPGNRFTAGCGVIGALSSDGSQAVGYFWSQALGWPLVWDQDEETAIQSAHGGSKISWGGPPLSPKVGRNRLHLDLTPPSGTDPATEVDRLLSLGATRGADQHPTSAALSLRDPDGNDFFVLLDRPPLIT